MGDRSTPIDRKSLAKLSGRWFSCYRLPSFQKANYPMPVYSCKSKTLPNVYSSWLKTTDHCTDSVQFVDTVYECGERNYDCGGDVIVETMTPEDILKQFDLHDLEDVKHYILLQLESALNCRFGNDDDPELIRYHKFLDNNET